MEFSLPERQECVGINAVYDMARGPVGDVCAAEGCLTTLRLWNPVCNPFPNFPKLAVPRPSREGTVETLPAPITASDLPTQAVLSRGARRWGRSHCRQQGVAADGPGGEEKKACGFPIRRHRGIQ